MLALSKIELLKKFLNLLYIFLIRDVILGIKLFRFRIYIEWIKFRNKVFINFFDQNVKRYRNNKSAILYQNNQEYGKYTFDDLSRLANKISNWIESSLRLGCDEQYEANRKLVDDSKINNGIEKINNSLNESKLMKKLREHHKSVKIGLMFSNCPELASFFIGITRVRCSAVLFNTNHRKDLLLNAFEAADCKVFIFESKYLPAIREIAYGLPKDLKMFMYDRQSIKDSNLSNIESNVDFRGITVSDLLDNDYWQESTGEGQLEQRKFAKILESYPMTPVRKKYPYKSNDILLYIFTSGTTGGKIKAAAYDNLRYLSGCLMNDYFMQIGNKDNIYICVPLYHSLGLIGLGSGLVNGSTITLVPKFSATNFWKDCYENGCTVAYYIGEICRFLMAKPKNGYERKHQIRTFFGAGLNQTIWNQFKQRFNIKKILEFYGSTEGNVNLVNYMGVPGSCGFIPYYLGPILRLVYPIQFLKVDPVTLEMIRDKNGLCQMAQPGDIGMLVGVIRMGDNMSQFLGYTSVQESSKKLIRNVLSHGDFAFVSGDLFEMDFHGNLFFKDRTGDTFRWRGENVSTNEIENVIAQFFDHCKCTVYGVPVANNDGCAGMMTIARNDQQQQFDLIKFYEFMRTRVPDYAIPKFIRITDQIPLTSTLKYMKYSLRQAGFDPTKMKPTDHLFYLDRNAAKYLSLDQDAYQKIMNGSIKF